VENPFSEMIQADMVLALPTEPETFGRIVTESLACGRVVLAFDRTGPGDILRQFEEAGKIPLLRVHPDDTNSLVERISFFMQHPKEVQKIVRGARPFVEKNYPLSETAKRLVGVLSE
jgi:glycosyltransferase involved in cell wall biosynthesis